MPRGTFTPKVAFGDVLTRLAMLQLPRGPLPAYGIKPLATAQAAHPRPTPVPSIFCSALTFLTKGGITCLQACAMSPLWPLR